jgi:hypothetical protein
MATGKDVYQDNTAADSARRHDAGGSPATTYEPGEKPFKDKGGKRGHGYNHVPGAGENPGKLDRKE